MRERGSRRGRRNGEWGVRREGISQQKTHLLKNVSSLSGHLTNGKKKNFCGFNYYCQGLLKMYIKQAFCTMLKQRRKSVTLQYLYLSPKMEKIKFSATFKSPAYKYDFRSNHYFQQRHVQISTLIFSFYISTTSQFNSLSHTHTHTHSVQLYGMWKQQIQFFLLFPDPIK